MSARVAQLLRFAGAVVAVSVCGCMRDGPVQRPRPANLATPPDEPVAMPPAAPERTVGFSAQDTRDYLAQLAPWLVSRELDLSELERVEADGEGAIEGLLLGWARDPGLPEAARLLISRKLLVGGTRDGVDFDLPGNLAAYVVRHDLPFSTILTADHCVDATGAKTACDTGAPFSAGVLATRAFLKSRTGRFNLIRARSMMRTFVCRDYPMDPAFQPRLDRATLIPLFQAQTPGEQTVPGAIGGFGNGHACFDCHGQFGAHAQLFVRFDSGGLYRADATGLQAPGAELGRSTNGLMASHLAEPAVAGLDRSQVLGKPVADLAEAARALTQSPAFVSCQARNLLELSLGLTPGMPVDSTVLDEIALRATRNGSVDPTFSTLMVETFTDPRIKRAVLHGLRGEP